MALTQDKAIEFAASGLPNPFMPGRIFFLHPCRGCCLRRGHEHLVGGMCETDYSGYPDCRDDTLKALHLRMEAFRSAYPTDVDRQGRNMGSSRPRSAGIS
ncbi:7-cyano-7-deazaguanine synthase [Bradyrhizobium elkanii]|nr:7-cyano-7-deazaguanine synthase [Bradyrhizobium elkanii]WLB14460.1 7-cyano-7-deazaguanine synthase [Bradyrhizobium elkanii]WLB76937.1 7-cyano-7-deazaguanine synthase [Bradyrhizobium elkanii]